MLSAAAKHLYNKASALPPLDRKTKSFMTDAETCSDYKKLHSCDRFSDSKDHAYMIYMLQTLSMSESLGLFNIKAARTLNLLYTEL